MQLGRPPLRVRIDGRFLHGYLRHRSFLHAVARGRELFARVLFLEALRPGMVVVDGGAHIGLYTLLASDRVGEAGRVYAFEPDSYNASALRCNVLLGRLANVAVVQKALSDTSGTILFHESRGTVGSSVFPRPVGRSDCVWVRSTTLDEELVAVPPALLVKLDVEGCEPQALAGMRRVLERAARSVLIVEVNPGALRRAGRSPTALWEVLTSMGFRLSFIDEGAQRLVPVRGADDVSTKGNLFCTKQP